MNGEMEGKWIRGFVVDGESGGVVMLFFGTW